MRCCGGAGLVVVPELVAASPEEFHALLAAEGGHCVDPDPVGAGRATRWRGWKRHRVGGRWVSACPAEVVDRWAPGRVMVNAYGSTATTMCVAISAPLSLFCG